LNTLVNFRPAQPSKTGQFSTGVNRFVSDSGKCCVSIRYGAKVLEIAKGKTAIEVASPDALIEALEAVNAAVLAGELDSQIEAVSGQLRSGFQK